MKGITAGILLTLFTLLIGINTASAKNSSFNTLAKQFCSLNTSQSHVIVTKATFFKQGKNIQCHHKKYRLRYHLDRTDRGHAIFNIDPPPNTYSALDCDGKADTGMNIIAINCFPVGKETVAHRKK